MTVVGPDQPIRGSNATIGDFWRWAYSDLTANDVRGVFAEFLVWVAVGGGHSPRRVPWDSVDVRVNGIGIEVKTSGLGQSWEQSRRTSPRFGTKPTRSWDEEAGTRKTTPRRDANVYVFAFHKSFPADIDSVLDLQNWEFYVVSTSRLDEEIGDQASIGLSTLRRLAAPTSYVELASAISRAAPRD